MRIMGLGIIELLGLDDAYAYETPYLFQVGFLVFLWYGLSCLKPYPGIRARPDT
jgi:hypothetical protein